MKNKNGFTLIELLVVVAIIAMIAGLVLLRISNASKDARNARRKADISATISAIQRFYIDGGKFKFCESCALGSMGGGRLYEGANSIMFYPTSSGKYPNNYLPSDRYLVDPLASIDSLCHYYIGITWPSDIKTYTVKMYNSSIETCIIKDQAQAEAGGVMESAIPL